MPHNHENKQHTQYTQYDMHIPILYLIVVLVLYEDSQGQLFPKYSSSISYGHGCRFGRQAFEDKLSYFLFPPIPLHPRPQAVTVALSPGVGYDGKTRQKRQYCCICESVRSHYQPLLPPQWLWTYPSSWKPHCSLMNVPKGKHEANGG